MGDFSRESMRQCYTCGNNEYTGFYKADDGYVCKCCGVWYKPEKTKDEIATETKCEIGYNHLRQYEFDKAREIFKNVILEKNDSINALWGLLLARFGVVFIKGFFDNTAEPVYCFPEYDELGAIDVIKSREYKKIMSVLEENDEDLQLSFFYEAKAKEMNRAIKKFTESKASTERDVFICVKISAATEQDPKAEGKAEDYEYAMRIYNDLQKRGKNVFFSFVTLENEVSSDDLIWVNLVKSKKMLLIGSREEYLESAWVKSEWKRWLFLERMNDMYICSMKHANENPKDILPHELRKSSPQIYTLDTYEKMLDDICGVKKAVVESVQAEKAERIKNPRVNSADGEIVYKNGKVDVLKYGIAKIEDNAYSGNNDIISAVIPEGVTEIGKEAFKGCGRLMTIKLPGSLEKIGSNAFPSNAKVYFRGEEEKWHKIIGARKKGNKNYSQPCESIYFNGKIVYSDNREDILEYDLEEIADNAYSGKKNIVKVILPVGIKRIGDNAFDGCVNIKDIYYPLKRAEWEKISIGCNNECFTNVAHIDGKIVYTDGREEVLEWGITEIEAGAYNKNEDIVRVVLPSSVKSISGEGSLLSGYFSGAFSGCIRLTSIAIPKSVTSIGDSAFRGCSGLASITIPESVTKIGYNAFRGCSSLTNITIPEGVTEIKFSAFSGCSSLTNITIPSTVTEIYKNAFFNCTHIADIYYSGSKSDWAKIKIGINNEKLNGGIFKRAKIHYNCK